MTRSHGSFDPRRIWCGPSDQVMLEGELREALIRINPEIGAVLSLK